MSGVVIAIIGGIVALTVAYLNAVLAESYRRFRDGSSLAAGLAGELASYVPAWPVLKESLTSIIQACDQGQLDRAALRPIERPRDLIFEESISKLGLLGPALVEDVVFVYSNIRAFRLAFELLMRDAAEMSKNEFRARCIACQGVLSRAAERGQPLISSLRLRATQRFDPEWPWSLWKAVFNRSGRP